MGTHACSHPWAGPVSGPSAPSLVVSSCQNAHGGLGQANRGRKGKPGPSGSTMSKEGRAVRGHWLCPAQYRLPSSPASQTFPHGRPRRQTFAGTSLILIHNL